MIETTTTLAASTTLATGVVASVVGFFLILLLHEWIRRRNLVANHQRTHSKLPADDFLRQVGVSPEQVSHALAARQGIANGMGVPVESVYPSDDWDYISRFSFDSFFDVTDISFEIEKLLCIKIGRDFWNPLFVGTMSPRQLTVGEIVQFFAANSGAFFPIAPSP